MRIERVDGRLGRREHLDVETLEQAQRTHDAMRLRGYRGMMPFGPLPPPGRRDRLILVSCLIGIAAAYGLLEWGVSG